MGALAEVLAFKDQEIAQLQAEIASLRAELEDIKRKADSFVEAAEAHRLELIVEDYVTEATKATYAEAREQLGLATGAIDPQSIDDAREGK